MADTVELRIRLSADSAKRLAVVAAMQGLTPSAVVEAALYPVLSFRLPDVPELPTAAVKLKRPAPPGKQLPGGGSSAA